MIRFPLRCRRVYRAFALHLAVARAQSFCMAFASFSCSRCLTSAGVRSSRRRPRPRSFASTSAIFFFLSMTLFRQNRQIMIRTQINSESASETARITVVRPWGSFGAGFHPGGSWILKDGVVEFVPLTPKNGFEGSPIEDIVCVGLQLCRRTFN